MGGLVIGSTMELVATGQNWLALTINQECNLDCAICYLGEKKANRIMSGALVEKLNEIARDMAGIAIIGTEPLLDEQSVKVIREFSVANKTHLITNGVNLSLFAESIKQVRRVDTSLDGGPKTYARSPSFAKIKEGARKWKDLSGGQVFVLDVFTKENIANVEDMLEGGHQLGAEKIYFSPYVRTLGGNERATPLRTEEIIEALLPFSRDDWKLMIDPYHAIFEWRDWNTIKAEIQRLPEKNRLIIDFDPGDRVRRIDADGKMRHPFMALHPGVSLPGRDVS